MMRRTPEHLTGRRAGFSLVEALIAVVVLALALLGLAAVFPAVVTEQRRAIDRTAGELVLDAAEATITGHDRLNYRVSNLQRVSGMQAWRLAFDPARPDSPNGWSTDGRWVMADEGDIRTLGGAEDPFEYIGQGDKLLTTLVVARDGEPDLDPDIEEVRIPIASRLWPAPYTGRATEPRYAWDFVARRVLGADRIPTGRDPVEFAIFVRRIDPNIPVPQAPRSAAGQAEFGPTNRLSDVLLASAELANPMQARFALGERSANNPTPTRDGSGDRYSPIHALDLELGKSAPAPDLLPVSASGAAQTVLLNQLARAGQRFVDSRGKVYTVRGREGENLIISPALSEAEQDDVGRTLGRIVFTTQTPIAIRVIRVQP